MDSSFLLYFATITSIVSLCVSVYTAISVKEKKVSEKLVEPVTYPILKAVPKEVVVQTPISTAIPAVTLESYPKHKPKGIPKEKHHKIEKVIETNKWQLEVTGLTGNDFSIYVGWSDGSIDVASGTAPIILSFEHPKHVVPERIVGMLPHGDKDMKYLWDLNGFHWS